MKQKHIFQLLFISIFITEFLSANMPIIGQIDTDHYSEQVTLNSAETKAFITNYSSGFDIIDISNPSNPTKIGAFTDTNGGRVYDIALSPNENIAYVALDQDGLAILDISDTSNIRKIGSYDVIAGRTRGVTLSADGTKLFLADYFNGLVVIDVSDPTNPTKIGHYLTDYQNGGQVWDVVLSQDESKAYLADHSKGLLILDVSDITSISKIGQYDTNGTTLDVALSSDETKAYVTDYENGLVIIDISNPANPTKIGHFAMSPLDGEEHSWAWRLKVSSDDNKVFIAYRDNGLVAVDVSDPTTPTFIDKQSTGVYTFGVTLSKDNTKAYTADYYRGLSIIDISALP